MRRPRVLGGSCIRRLLLRVPVCGTKVPGLPHQRHNSFSHPQAAAESPFLDNKLESATGVLCVLRVPPSALGVGVRPAAGPTSSTNTPLVADNHKEYALRSAVQVAAMTVRELAGRHCHDIIVCPQLCQDLESPPPRAQQQQQQQAVAAQDAATAGPAAGGAEGGEHVQVIHTQVEAPNGMQLVRVEVSLLVLESIEEMGECNMINAKAEQRCLPL